MADKRLQTALQWALIGFLIGYALSLFQHPKAEKPVSKDQSRKMNRQFVRDVLLNEAMPEVKDARS